MCIRDRLGGRPLTDHADEGHQPAVVLHGEGEAAAALTGPGCDGHVPAAVEVGGVTTEEAGAVVDTDLHPFLVGRIVSEALEPLG